MARVAGRTHIVSGLQNRQEHHRQAGFLRCPCCNQGRRAPSAVYESLEIENLAG
jgi:hypothetical protein